MIEYTAMQKAIYIISIIVLIGLAALIVYPEIKSRTEKQADATEIGEHYQAFLSEHNLRTPIEGVNLVVTKNNKRLYLLVGERMIESWPVGLGTQPEGAKALDEDGKTPVGSYSICQHDLDTRYHLYIALTYPGRHDADGGLRDNLISEREHQAIYRAVTLNELPPQDTALGCGIGIHGGGQMLVTNGSIAVENEVVDILWSACPDGTPVTIYEEFTDWELADVMLSSQ